MTPSLALSDDQAAAYDQVADLLNAAGVNLTATLLMPPKEGDQRTLAITG